MNGFENNYNSERPADNFENVYGAGFDDDFDAPLFDEPQRRPAPQPREKLRSREPAARPVNRTPKQARFEEDYPSESTDGGFNELEPLFFDTNNHKKHSDAATVVTKVLMGTLAVCCALACALVPSGDRFVTDAEISDSLSASLDMKIGFDNLMLNVINTAHGLPKVYTLPMTDSPASAPREENYSTYTDDEGIVHSTYIDDTISVDCWRKRYYVNDVSTVAAVSKIKITHPTQLRTAFAGGQYGPTRLKPSTISKQVNAIVSINGELYNYAEKNSVLVRQGTVYRDDIHVSDDLLFIDSNGDFHVMTSRDAVEQDILHSKDYSIYQSVCFGPALVIDGEVVGWGGKTENTYYRNPRSGIGQTGPLEYLLVAAEGRADDSKGLNTSDLAVLMKDLGCIQAYNLDGGQSSMMIFHNRPFNHISNGSERTFSDIIYFGSALPEE